MSIGRKLLIAERGQARRWPCCRAWALALLLGICWANGVLAAPLFPPQCNVILLAGLPGDIENENSYRQQLQTWLEIISEAGPPEQVFVLCDNPAAVIVPERVPVKVRKGDRVGFLGLSHALSGRTNPLVVIAWGHGGRQGATPVLHVRGPRLTPVDFTGLAAKLPASESRWVLLFRGSGAFARELAGDRRQVISSEGETMFNSDPVGMSVLLKTARSEATITFGKLAVEFGRGTAAWYDERHLARMEEPTLWLANEPPRPLVGDSAGDSLATANLDARGSVAAEVKPGATNQPPADPLQPEAVSSELPPLWQEIKKVEAQKFPDADGVILRQSISCTLGNNPAFVSEQDEFLQILTAEGKHFGDFDVSYSPPEEEIEFLDCEVLRPDGKLVRLAPDGVNEAHEEAVGDYHGARRKFFALPGVVPGAVLHVRYRTQWKNFPLPQISMELPLGQESPARDTSIRISVPRETPFHFAFEALSAPDPAIQQTSYSTSYSWHFDWLPAAQPEALVAPRQKGRLVFSTFADWAAFADWYGRISQLTDVLTPEITTKAQELTHDAKDDRAKVLALYNYVTALRYVAIPLGVNSFRPHAAAQVLQSQFGDCKDKANLLNALLHSVNIPAHLVLVPRFSQANESVPGLAFNHAISRVTLGNETVWVDTTDDICRFGLLPPGDPGRKVLVIDGKTTALTLLPTPEPKDHVLHIQGRVDCSNIDGPSAVTLKAVGIGYPDYQLREAAREAKERRGSLPLLSAPFRPAEGTFVLEKQSATAVSALEENFSWQAQGTCVGLASEADGKLLLRAPFWLPKEWEQALHRRHAPLFLNQGYPLTLEQEFEMALPARVLGAALPHLCENSQKPLRWRVEWARISDDKLAIRLHAELARGELSAADTPAFQQQLRALLSTLSASAALKLPPIVSKP